MLVILTLSYTWGSHEPFDFSEPEKWANNLLKICANSDVKNYWYLLFEYARNIPSLKSIIQNYLIKDTLVMQTSNDRLKVFMSTKQLMTVPDFLMIKWPSSGFLLEYFLLNRFRKLRILETIQVDVTSLADKKIVSRIPESLKGVLPWYPLHLALLCRNTAAVFAVICEVSSEDGTLNRLKTVTIADFTLGALLNCLEEAESDLQVESSVPEFVKILKKP